MADYKNHQPEYAPALGGKLNLFRFFLVKALQLTKSDGRFGMIVPLALVADITSARTRKHVLLSLSELRADCFPQKDNASRRVFRDAKLSTVIITGKRSNVVAKNAGVNVRVYPWNSLHDSFKESFIKMEDAALLDPETIPIPLVGEDEWSLLKKIQKGSRVVRLGELQGVSITRGEINQTVYRDFITSNQRDVRLVKGVEVGPYFIRSTRSQGIQEWFDEDAFLKFNNPKGANQLRRIATQRITGVDERRRLVAAIVDPPAYFADSTNSIASTETGLSTLEYLIALLNSTLFQWRFRLTSTNNNVGTNELDALPIRQLAKTDSTEKAQHDELVKLVRRLTQLKRNLETARVTQRDTLQRQADAIERSINDIVYGLFNLAESEVELIERLEHGEANEE